MAQYVIVPDEWNLRLTLPAWLLSRLQEASASSGDSLGEILRVALDEYLAENPISLR